ncbi:MAG: DNA polymerase III subunit chi [Anderseniella sp.]
MAQYRCHGYHNVMTEVFFYHLERARLEDVLPLLIKKTMERGWRAVVQTVSDERIEAISSQLWQWKDDEFLAHGSKADGHSEHQPVWLTTETDNPNNARVRFLVDGADMAVPHDLERYIIMFDGNDEVAVAAARTKWKSVTAEGFTATYWQQDERGSWVKKATTGDSTKTDEGRTE